MSYTYGDFGLISTAYNAYQARQTAVSGAKSMTKQIKSTTSNLTTESQLKSLKEQLATGHNNLFHMRDTLLPQLDRKIAATEQSFQAALRLADIPIPKLTPGIPIGLIAGGLSLLLMGSVVAITLMSEPDEDKEKPSLKRKASQKEKLISRKPHLVLGIQQPA